VVRLSGVCSCFVFVVQAEDGIRARNVTGVQTCALPISGTVAQWPGDPRSVDRYIEIWNLVFDEFLRGPGTGTDYALVGELEQKRSEERRVGQEWRGGQWGGA